MSFMRVAVLALFVAPGLLLVACGDDDDGRTGGTDSGTGTEMDAATGGEDASMAVTDQCTNASDMAAIQEEYGDPPQDLPAIAADCGLGCLADSDPGTCATTCIVDGTGDAVSAGCSSCYSMSFVCTLENCAADCSGDPSSEDCIACRCGDNAESINCFDVFSACSGIPSDACAGM